MAIQLFVPTELVLVLKIIQLAAVTPGVKKKKVLFFQFLLITEYCFKAGYSPWGCKESDKTEWLTPTNSFKIETAMSTVIPAAAAAAELLQILKDDAVKVLHSICQQIW